MYKTSFRISLLVIILMLPWVALHAAGLGKLTINSALGQPFDAEIDIVTTDDDDVQSLKTGIVSREAYAQTGISYEPVLASIKTAVALRANGNPYIKLTSPQAVNDPFLMVLMELSWATGRVLREYTVLLDPIDAHARDFTAPNTVHDFESVELRQIDPTGQAKNTYGPVNRGDTLSAIARQVMPSNINLNQMLVALYRANRNAFIADNMNLLKTGVVLAIPEHSEIAAIDAASAAAEIKVQTGNWRNYQGKLAALSKETPIARDITQSDQGKITTIDSKPSAITEAPKEVLKLSSGAQLTEGGGESSDSSLVDRLRMMEEDAIARNSALKEASERVAVLEKSIQNLKHLLELKDSVLAQAQMNAESLSTIGETPKAQLPEAIELTANPEVEIPHELASIDEQTAVQPVTESDKAIAADASAEDSSWIDTISQYYVYIAAISILILLLILLITRRRRAKLQKDEAGDDNREDFSSAMRSRMTAMAGAQSAAAVANEYASSEYQEDQSDDFQDDSEYYNEHAVHEEAYQSSTESESESFEEESAQDTREFDQNSQDDEEKDSDQTAGTLNNIDVGFDLTDEVEAGNGDFTTKETADEEPDENTLTIDFNETEPSDSIAIDEEEKTASIDFDLTEPAIDLTEDAIGGEKSSLLNEQISLADEIVANEPIAFETARNDAPDSAETEPDIKLPELGLADINLDLDEQPQAEEAADNERWQEVETKLDLAKAYLEMDDKEGAKEMLDEIMQDGDAKQKKAAKKMLKNL